ncbi:MAG: hypothetical protein HC880_10325 [Bacteroidia bacterium]|nr:hypothetical protein [Bacteroidia bacterium]
MMHHKVNFMFLLSIIMLLTCKNSVQQEQDNPTLALADSIKTKDVTEPNSGSVHPLENSYDYQKYFYIDLPYYLHKSYLKNDKDKTKDILYYYKRFPPFLICSVYSDSDIAENYYREHGLTEDFYLDKILYSNIAHGFMKVRTCDLNPNAQQLYGIEYEQIELALFRHKNRDIIAYNYSNLGGLLFFEFNENTRTWTHGAFGDMPDRVMFHNSRGAGRRTYFRLPEFGTEILCYQDTSTLNRASLKNPDAFWQDKLQNAPQKIIRLKWQDGKFVIEPPESKRLSGGE